MPNKIILVDGNSMINRSFYGVPVMENQYGQRTNAIYGFLSTLFRICDEQKPTHLAVVFDTPAPVFRKCLFPGYKASRKPMPSELRPQFGMLKNLLDKMHIRYYEKEGFEGDDVIGTISKRLKTDGFEIIILSGDGDLLQLIDKNIKVFMPKTRQKHSSIHIYDDDAVFDEFGITPKQLPDMKAIMGDKADDIVGVPGIGIKNAIKLIKDYKTIENALDILRQKEIKELTRCEGYLLDFSEQVLMYKKLVTIKTDVDIDISLEDIEIKNMFNQEFKAELDKLQIGSFSKRFVEANSN